MSSASVGGSVYSMGDSGYGSYEGSPDSERTAGEEQLTEEDRVKPRFHVRDTLIRYV